ncbi:hypothetical protein VTO73DRAFT_5840 [Trametes versicolor]
MELNYWRYSYASDHIFPQAATSSSSVRLNKPFMARLPSSPSRRTPTAQWPVCLRTWRTPFFDYVKHVDGGSSEALPSFRSRLSSSCHLAKFGAAAPYHSNRHLVKLGAAHQFIPSKPLLKAPTRSVILPPARHPARPPRQPSPFPPAAFHDVDQAPTDFKLVCSLNAAVSRGSSPHTADVPPYVKQTPLLVSTARHLSLTKTLCPFEPPLHQHSGTLSLSPSLNGHTAVYVHGRRLSAFPNLEHSGRFGDRLVDRSSSRFSSVMFCFVTSTSSRGPRRARRYVLLEEVHVFACMRRILGHRSSRELRSIQVLHERILSDMRKTVRIPKDAPPVLLGVPASLGLVHRPPLASDSNSARQECKLVVLTERTMPLRIAFCARKATRSFHAAYLFGGRPPSRRLQRVKVRCRYSLQPPPKRASSSTTEDIASPPPTARLSVPLPRPLTRHQQSDPLLPSWTLSNPLSLAGVPGM